MYSATCRSVFMSSSNTRPERLRLTVMALLKGVDDGVQLTFEVKRTCYDALPNLEHDGIQVAEMLCWVGEAHIDGDSEVDAMFVVE